MPRSVRSSARLYARLTPAFQHPCRLDRSGNDRFRQLPAGPCCGRKKGLGHGHVDALTLPRPGRVGRRDGGPGRGGTEPLPGSGEVDSPPRPADCRRYQGCLRPRAPGAYSPGPGSLSAGSTVDRQRHRGQGRRALRPGRRGTVARAAEKFYQSIARSEERHFELFLELAEKYLARDVIAQRWDELLDAEAAIAAQLPIRSALH